MDSIDNFRNSLSEFDILIDYARRNISKVDKYQLFIKLSVVLLSTKLEVFIEDFVEEHSIRMLKGHTNISLPQDIKNNYLNRAVELIANERKQHKKTSLFQSMYILLQDNGIKITSTANIKPSTSFSYGKHGQSEIESLFERHGLGIFIKTRSSQDCLKVMNSLISIRNNVIHQDVTPGTTYQTIIGHKNNILNFIDLLEEEIEGKRNLYYNE